MNPLRTEKIGMRVAATFGFGLVILAGCEGSRIEPTVHAVAQMETVGEYWNGPGVSGLLELHLKSNADYCFSRSSDIGTLEEGCGAVHSDDGWFQFVDKTHKHDSVTSRWWRLVRWGDRQYLVQEDMLIAFINWVNLGLEPRTEESGLFLFRKGDAVRAASGEPILPDEWRRLIFPRTLAGRVVKVFSARQGEIDIGEADGLRPGLLLLAETDNGYFEVEVVTASSGSSFVRIESDADSPLEIGQRVISRWPR